MGGIREQLEEALRGDGGEDEDVEQDGGDEPVGQQEAPELGAEAQDKDESTDEEKPSGGRSRDGKGRFSPKGKEEVTPDQNVPKDKEIPGDKKSVSPKLSPVNQPPAADPHVDRPVDYSKAPPSLKPFTRQNWDKIPKQLREDIDRRERETLATMSEAAESRKGWGAFRETITPYAPMLGNADPVKAVGNLLQTAHVLNYGNPVAKAQMAAHIIRNSGIDIDALANALDGSPANGANRSSQPQSFDPQAFAQQIESNLMQKIGQTRQQALVQQRTAEYEQFKSTHPYAEDIKQTMAGIFSAKLASNFEEAYSLALSHPKHSDIKAILDQQEAAKRAKNVTASTQRAKIASSSVKSQPTSQPGNSGEPRSLREQLREALEDSSE